MATNNQVILTGNLGQDPEDFTNAKGQPFIRLSLSTTDSYKEEKSGEWKDKDSVWHTVFVFGPNACAYARSFQKGDRVKITGSLSYQTTTAMIEGETRYFNNATIIARRIEDARLPRKQARTQTQTAVLEEA